MSEQDVVLSSRVRLARNYEDLPFDLGEKPEAAAMCVARTVQALGLEEGEPQGNLIRLRDLTPIQQQSLAEAIRSVKTCCPTPLPPPCFCGNRRTSPS